MTETMKDILKPIRRKAQVSTGISKMIYDDMLRQIDQKFTEATRQEIIDELERQRRETQIHLAEDKRWLKWLEEK